MHTFSSSGCGPGQVLCNALHTTLFKPGTGGKRATTLLHAQVYEEETNKFGHLWDRRVAEYEAHVGKAAGDLRAAHERQRRDYIDELSKRPAKHKPSRVSVCVCEKREWVGGWTSCISKAALCV